MSTQDELKRAVAQAAIRFIKDGEIIGVGTGSTADYFIDELGTVKHESPAQLPSSERSAKRLAQHGIRCSRSERRRIAVGLRGWRR